MVGGALLDHAGVTRIESSAMSPQPPPLPGSAPESDPVFMEFDESGWADTPKRRSRFAMTCLVLLIIGGVLFVGAVSWFFIQFSGEFEQQLQVSLEGNEVILEHLGEIEEVDISWIKSGEHDDEEVFVMEVTGSQGSGTVTAPRRSPLR